MDLAKITEIIILVIENNINMKCDIIIKKCPENRQIF